MTEPREALAALLHEAAIGCVMDVWLDCPSEYHARQADALIAIEAEAAAGVHLGDEGLREALVNLRSHAHHAGYCAAGEPGGSKYCICGLTEALVESERVLAAQENPA